MTKEKIIHDLFEEISHGNIKNILSFFSEDAVIHSPVYKTIEVEPFYKALFQDLKKIETKIIRIFHCPDKPTHVAVHLMLKATLKDGQTTENEGVNILAFEEGRDKIHSMKIIYDARSIGEKLKKFA